jgi:hypothetical protein
MNHDLSMSDASDTASATGSAAATRNVCYVESASFHDVLFDQLEYLLIHANAGCPPECQECARLEQAKNALLGPFRQPALRSGCTPDASEEAVPESGGSVTAE